MNPARKLSAVLLVADLGAAVAARAASRSSSALRLRRP